MKRFSPHPRYYRQLAHCEPFPGVMDVCIECPHRDGVRCTHPLLKANGGPGLEIMASPPIPVFMDGRDSKGHRTGWVEFDYGYNRPKCRGRGPFIAAGGQPESGKP